MTVISQMAPRSTTRCAKHYTYGWIATQPFLCLQAAREEWWGQSGGTRT